MEPVPVTRRVRRTVRMAVALVVGQAMLCALIGWLTLGRHRSEPSRPPGSPVVDQLAVPPLTGAAPSSSRGAISATSQVRPARAATTRPAPARTPTTAPSGRSPASSPQPIQAPPEKPEVVPPVPPVPSTSATTTPDKTLTPSPASTTPAPSASPGTVQEPVRVGDECDPMGAYGRTAEGELVRCLRDWRHGPRWKIV